MVKIDPLFMEIHPNEICDILLPKHLQLLMEPPRNHVFHLLPILSCFFLSFSVFHCSPQISLIFLLPLLYFYLPSTQWRAPSHFDFPSLPVYLQVMSGQPWHTQYHICPSQVIYFHPYSLFVSLKEHICKAMVMKTSG